MRVAEKRHDPLGPKRRDPVGVSEYGRRRSTSLLAVTICPDGGFSDGGKPIDVDRTRANPHPTTSRAPGSNHRDRSDGQQARHRVTDVAVDICIDEVLGRRRKLPDGGDELGQLLRASQRVERNRRLALHDGVPLQGQHRVAELHAICAGSPG